MKLNKYILLAFAMLSFASCFEDESTFATNPIAEITIDESSMQKVYNIDKNEVLEITPVVTQKNKELPLTYAWELDQQVVDSNKVFVYKGDKLGTYNGRLIVSNSDGKAFFTFTLNVNSPYEYGITVLSKDAEGRPHIAFMQEPMKEGDKSEFYKENCLETNNPGQFFASNPSDIIQTTGTMIVACQGKDDDPEDGAAIYFLNEKTFVMENLVESDYEGFKPTRLLTPQGSYDGSAYPVLSADGKMYSLPTYNAVLQPSHNFLSTYAQVGFARGNATNNDIIVWDKEVNGLVCLYNGYGPYYCGSKYLLQRDSLQTDNYYIKNFSELEKILTLTYIHKTSKQVGRSELLAIVKAPYSVQKVVISTFFWRAIEGKVGAYDVMTNGKAFTKAARKSSYSIINESTPCIANATYETLLFADGNKVMKWFYFKDDYLEDAIELRKVGSDDAIITSFDISEDHMKTYVAFYEPKQEGKNGSVWVLDTNSGVVLEKYDNVCYQPVKVLYKKK
jgi:hypothetical protein